MSDEGQNRTKRDGSVRDLDIYHLAHDLGVEIHHLTLRLPKAENYEIGSQLRRSKSVSANIVEGYGRREYRAEFVRFLIYAHASCDESCEWMRYISDCYPSLAGEAFAVQTKLNELGGKLNKFIRAVEIGHLTRK